MRCKKHLIRRKTKMQALLSVRNLSARLKSEDQCVSLLNNINFEICPEQTVALLGETGSGKSLTALSICRLLSQSIFLSPESEVLLQGKNLLTLSEIEMRRVRGKQIAMIFQEPTTSFNPVFTIGHQIEEVLLHHQRLARKGLEKVVYRLLENVHIAEVERVYKAYPHQLSGGMKQRAMIAMALAGEPKLLIADEPTTALDVITQAQILVLLKQLQAKFGMGILFITHDLSVAAEMADQIIVMQAGRIIEQRGELQKSPLTPHPPQPPLKGGSFQRGGLEVKSILNDAETLLSVEHLDIYFPIKRGIFNKTVGYVRAVEKISLTVRKGETLAIVGESGSGKTTLARGIMSLIKPTQGEVDLLGENLAHLSQKQLRKKRAEFQIIFQDPLSAMDPRCRIKAILEEGMIALKIGADQNERDERINALLDAVGLLPEHLTRYPHQLSGGQRQRVCIARALAVGPRLLVCDEPTSSLDVSVQAQIIDLFIRLQKELEIAYLFITHNIALVRTMAHRVIVMKDGKMVEQGTVEQVLNAPQHPYTKALLIAAGRGQI